MHWIIKKYRQWQRARDKRDFLRASKTLGFDPTSVSQNKLEKMIDNFQKQRGHL